METEPRGIEFKKSPTDRNCRKIIRDDKEIGYISFPQGDVTLLSPEGFLVLTQLNIESILEIINSEIAEVEAGKHRISFI